MRYDVCVIGASTDGLAAAATAALAGLKTIVVERANEPGGRAVTREFHPGFRASPFMDELAPIPREIHWALDLTRRGAIFSAAPNKQYSREAEARIHDIVTRAYAEADRVPEHRRFPLLHKKESPRAWPAEDWATRALNDVADEATLGRVLAGRAVDPYLAGTALHLLAPNNSGMVAGGLGRLGAALASAARDAGAEISLGHDVSDIRNAKHKASGVGLADGSEIEARAIISTLDLKRTFLSLFQWNTLPPATLKRASHWRMGGGTARVLFALGEAPERKRGAIAISSDAASFAAAAAACRAGTIPESPPVLLRMVSACDPNLAPRGAATITATLSGIPFRLFDGAWTLAKREMLHDRALAALESAWPGAHVIAADIIAPPDIEEALGATDGDLWGGEIASDQMLDLRPGPRTEIEGLYLAGPSSAAAPHATCAAGVAAARAILADIKAGRLK